MLLGKRQSKSKVAPQSTAVCQHSSVYRASTAEGEEENKQESTRSKASQLVKATAGSWRTSKRVQKIDSGLPEGKGKSG